MAVPSRRAAARTLRELDPPAWLVGHSAAVAEVASFLAQRLLACGTRLDTALVEAAALLHDVDKALPADHPLKQLGHGAAGAAWLSERGHPELAAAVAGHPATLLGDDERYPRWAATASWEERVVAYADKRAKQDVVPLAARFAEWERRYPESAESIRTGRARAELLEHEVCAAAGISPTEVRRLAWVSDLMDAPAA